MSIVRVYRVIPLEVLKLVVPQGCGAKDAEVEIEFGHAESVGTRFLECDDNLLVFVAVRVHWEALYILKRKRKVLLGLGRSRTSPHEWEDVSRLGARPIAGFWSLATPCISKEDCCGLDTRASVLGQGAGSSRKIPGGM
jgi:hypothetical protein